MDYLMPTAGEIPEVTVRHLETPSTRTPLGLKGAGEAGATGSAAAIANAVSNALADLDIDITQTPITPPYLCGLIRTAMTRTKERSAHEQA
jgi:CO/xanthine dehydrogenase Mo-binding subunit